MTTRYSLRARNAAGAPASSVRSLSQSPTRTTSVRSETRAPSPVSESGDKRTYSEVAASRPASPTTVGTLRPAVWETPTQVGRLATGPTSTIIRENVPRVSNNKNLFTDSDESVPRRQKSEMSTSESDTGDESKVRNEWTTIPQKEQPAKKSTKPVAAPKLSSKHRYELTEEQLSAIDKATRTMKAADQQKVAKRLFVINAPDRRESTEDRQEGPSEPKGKTVDPRNWGAAGLSESELDVEAQATALASIQRKEPEPARQRSLDHAPGASQRSASQSVPNVAELDGQVQKLKKRSLPDASKPSAQINPRSYLGVALAKAAKLDKGHRRRRGPPDDLESSDSTSSSDSESDPSSKKSDT
ncbi:hypothetical protein CVT26_015016 [Gymnopilus dilepis]|uniref:Uncharacterized protein n=1 Tax=Gymnopilus dilepis TaxID=231916 RepID=A0A409YNQ9_9AGAR|nr:hypothetical protein CVT26_015016 [Gymnopilus dilepis]